MSHRLRDFLNRMVRHARYLHATKDLVHNQRWRDFVGEASFEFDRDRFAQLDAKARTMIYVAAPIARSGHNFLARLIQAHPDVCFPKGRNLPGEHNLLDASEQLIIYARQTSMRWKRWIEGTDALDRHQANVIRCVGNGVIDYYYHFIPPGKRLLLKTSTATKLYNFQPLFPTSQLVILLRDGRDTIESFTKTWGDSRFEHASRMWARQVNGIYDYIEDQPSMAEHVRLVRYEDAHQSTLACMASLFDFLGLEHSKCDWADVESVPVVGSSIWKQRAQVNWHEKMPRAGEFKPIGKWKDWNKKRRNLFKKVAGRALIRAGYAEDLTW